jgi:plasmid stabilization system protein ParE
MKYTISVSWIVLVVLLSAFSTCAQKNPSLADNAALRYWSAFSAVQDAAITDQEAKELNSVLESMGPYDDSKYKDLLQKNTLALEVMARGTLLSNCDWGLDYELGEDVPVEYARKALVLGRLNVLYAIHLYHTGNKDGAIRALAAGLRFSHDVGSGGSLFATLIAKDLLVTHLMAVNDALRMEQLSASQRSRLQNAVAELGDGLDWSAAAKRDLEGLRGHYATDAVSSAALTRIISSYVAALDDPSKLPALDAAIHSGPQQLANLIPLATRVLEQKQDLNNRLLQTRSPLK